MSKWKCGICNSEFDNFQAQGFDETIYCPLCYFKELYRRTKIERDKLENIRKEAIKYIGTNITARALEQLCINYELGESLLFVKIAEDLLNILNKGENNGK